MMELKTKVHAEDDKQEIQITREFDLPVALLFKAYTEPDLLRQWMGTTVLKLENRPHGSWQFETTNPQGMVVFKAHGVIHDFVPEQKIIRTFEMENTSFPPQLEFLDFEALTEETSRLQIQMVFRSVAVRDQLLQLPFVQGINMAHNQLQRVLGAIN